MAIDPAAAYQQAQQSLSALLRGCDAAALDTLVPACPLWSVADVARHLSGVAADVVAGTMPADLNPVEMWQTAEGAEAGNAYTDNHVQSRRGVAIGEVLAEWEATTVDLLRILRREVPAPQPLAYLEVVPVSDIAVHLQDVRGALGQPGDRESDALKLGLAAYAIGAGMRLGSRGLPALRIRYDDRERVVGVGEPVATWSGDRFEIFRALAGRRSRAQILAMDWDGEGTVFAPVIPAYGERADDLVE
jgi:uncharacterized protein (TIGR03083 family)